MALDYCFSSSSPHLHMNSINHVKEQCIVWRRPRRALRGCRHPIFLDDVCISCGKPMDKEEDESNQIKLISLNYVHQGLRVTPSEMERLRLSEQTNLVSKRKLCLVLDLDHTLLHTIRRHQLSSQEKYLCSKSASKDESGSLFQWNNDEGTIMLTKLRPYLHTFLEEANTLFDLYIYTMGSRPYALSMTQFLDPERRFFDFKIISKEDCTKNRIKSLDVVPVPETNVVILDDTETVWADHKDNLIVMDRYQYFVGHEDGSYVTSLAESHRDESDTEGALALALQKLKFIHHCFFTRGNPMKNDVRPSIRLTDPSKPFFPEEFEEL